MTVAERFHAKYTPEPNTGCWLWGAATMHGYGILQVDGSARKAHRVSYELHKGRIPEGLVIDHICREKSCVNPDHLEIVTNAENIRRGISPSAENGRKAKCVRGHDLSGDNLYVEPSGKRQCKKCNAFRARRDRRRAKERKG